MGRLQRARRGRALIGPIGWLGLIFGVPIWTLVTSLFVPLGSRERAQAAAATA